MDELDDQGESGFPNVPSFTEADWEKRKADDDLMAIAFPVFQNLGIALIKLANTHEATDNHRKLRTKLEYKIMVGFLMRISRLMLAMIKLTAEAKYRETTFILQRCVSETAINIMQLAKRNDPELFREYIRSSLSAEKKLYDVIQRNVKDRGGVELPIEASMKRSISNALRLGKVSIEEISPKYKEWGGSSWQKFDDLGLGLMHLGAFRISSHAVHGSFPDLLMHYLKESEDGDLHIREEDNFPEEIQLVAPGLLVVLAAQEFVKFAFFESEVRSALSDYFAGFGQLLERVNLASIEVRHPDQNSTL